MHYNDHDSFYDDNSIQYDEQSTNYYPAPGQKPVGLSNHKRRRVRKVLGVTLMSLLIVAILLVSVYVARNLRFSLTHTDKGFSLSISQKTAAAQPEQAEQPSEPEAPSDPNALPQPDEAQNEPDAPPQPDYAPVGTGVTLELSKSPASAQTAISSEEDALCLQDIYEKVIDSVVSISAVSSSSRASGTGIIMSPDGYIITNHHVIENALSVSVLTSSDEQYDALLVGSDETSDIAVLKIDAQNLQAAQFGDSATLRVGDAVVAIGDPLGVQLRGTMTNGIISAINRDLTVGDRSMTLIQTNAALNNGNSGGPLINCYGQVIGINTMKMSSYYSEASVEGLGFAIPISVAKPIIDELIENGYVAGRPAIGISGESLPKAFQTYYRLPTGVYVVSVDPDSDAAARGIAEGDIITAINDTAVSSIDELNTVKNQFSAGDTVTLTVYRNGQFYLVDVLLSDRATMGQ